MANYCRRMASPLSSFVPVLLLIVVAMQSQAWALDAEVADDMVPVKPAKPAKPVVVAITGGGDGVVGTLAAPLCLQCRCCSKTNPSNCELTSCSSTFNCDPAGKCTLVQQRCGC
uniref:Bowman-Birk serine protease inhibitors family domain-containing protein n=1 Tax=Oryza meridionalis TaxID=40149 RepID=A0A0E0FCD1_9ORYZ